MRNINNISPKIYFILNVIISSVYMIIYRSTMFRCLFYSTYNDSMKVFIAIWVVCTVASYVLTRKRRRNYFSLFTNAILPLGIYSLIVYENFYPTVVLTIEAVIYVLCGAYCLLVLARRINVDAATSRGKVILSRFRTCLNGMKSICAVCSSVIMIYILVLFAFDLPMLIPAVKPTEEVVGTKQEVLVENIPAISGIDPSVWKTLTIDERIDTMQTLANIERVQLGIGHEINVCADALGWGTYGTYKHSNHQVTLNFDILEDNDPTDCVVTLCHELRHSFQRNVSEAYLSLDDEFQQLAIFDDSRDYYENFEDYKNVGEDGFSEYENQTVEKDSREYSEKRAVFYFTLVNAYVTEAA